MGSPRRLILLAVALLASLLARDALAGPPTDQVRATIERVLKVLDNPELKKEGRARERRAVVRAIVEGAFDLGETTKRSLGRHWQGRTAAEREEMVKLFGDLLERAYLSKVELYGGEKIVYLGDSIDGDLATVRTRLVSRQGTEIPVDYRMLRRDDRWRAYDVSIEGVSLIANYRSQFNRVIQSSSFQELVKKLQAKNEEGQREAEPGGPSASRQ